MARNGLVGPILEWVASLAEALGVPLRRGRSEEEFRSLLESSPEIVLVIENDATVSYASPAVRSVLGRPPDELTGTGVSRHLSSYDPSWTLEDCVKRVSGPGAWASLPPVKLQARHADGSRRHLEALVAPVWMGTGEEKAVAYVRDVTERRTLEEKLVHLAFHDALTGLANRALLLDRLEHALARAARQGGCVSILFADLDDFKAVNDGFGHEVGDRVLVTMGRRLRSCLRPEDTLSRFGGDEFVGLLEDTMGASDAEKVAQRMTRALREPITFGDEVVALTASIGVSTTCSGGERAEELVRSANSAMYRAKRAGKNRCEASGPARAERRGTQSQ